jgi:hypothetical protein
MDMMTSIARIAIAAVFLQSASAGHLTGPVAAQRAIDAEELAKYRLTRDVFERFVKASSRIGDITRADSAFSDKPLFTKDVALSGDAVEETKGLVARLENHAGLAAALEAAKITPREYSKFAIALIAAHLAHGFVKAGVLRDVPPGTPAMNVEFVRTHESQVTATLAVLGIRD